MMKKSQISVLCLLLGLCVFPTSRALLAGLPIGSPAPGTTWTITYKESTQKTKNIAPSSPEHAMALQIHRKMVPQLVKSHAHRIGDEFFKTDYYANNTKLQAYITPKMFLEEARSGDQIVAISRLSDDVLEKGVTYLFFPELAHFDQAEQQGVVSGGTYPGMLKYTLSSNEDKAHRKMVAAHLREQGIETDIDKTETSDQYIIIDPKTKLPFAFHNGSATAAYVYSPSNQKPALTPPIQKL